MPNDATVVTRQDELAPLLRAAASAPIVAVDVEGNGLFAYRARLCTVQLAWTLDGRTSIAIVDTLTLDPRHLQSLLGDAGPPKVLHDFTFDAKLLADAGVTLAQPRDTSVLARMLGRKATGLASLLASELGIVVAKDLQQHDWARRPLREVEIEYLASDVRYLVALHEKLAAAAHALDIDEEVEVECAFKYDTALAPPRDKRPAWTRVKGADALDPPALAVLRRLVDARESIAEEWDEPPFKVASNEVLLVLARLQPPTVADLARIRRGMSARLLQVGPRLVEAVAAGLADPPIAAAELQRGVRLDRAVIAARRARERRLSGWRRTEAAQRGVDEQVVLPGHCLADLVGVETPDLAAIAQVKGLGPKRLARYGAVWETLLANAEASPAEPADAEPTT